MPCSINHEIIHLLSNINININKINRKNFKTFHFYFLLTKINLIKRKKKLKEPLTAIDQASLYQGVYQIWEPLTKMTHV